MSDSFDTYRQLLAETLQWCRAELRNDDPKHCFRSSELRPRRNVVQECESDWGVDRVVLDLTTRRKLLLESVANAPQHDAGVHPGDRLLAFRPQDSLSHGSSPPESDGYIDDDEIAPWDTWICSVDGLVFSWVPRVFVPLVDSAIRVNPEECIRWAVDWHDPIANAFRVRVFFEEHG